MKTGPTTQDAEGRIKIMIGVLSKLRKKVSQHSYLGKVTVAKSGTTTTTVKEKQGKTNVRKKKK